MRNCTGAPLQIAVGLATAVAAAVAAKPILFVPALEAVPAPLATALMSRELVNDAGETVPTRRH